MNNPPLDPRAVLMGRLANPVTYAEERLGIKPHPKHAAVLRDLFKLNSRVSVRCANEVGKTSTLAVTAIHYHLEILRGTAISTAGVWMQVASQLIPKLKLQQHKFPDWEYQDTGIKINGVQRYLGFSTRDEGTAQGFHAGKASADDAVIGFNSFPNDPLLAIIDEAAAVPPGIFAAIEERCNPTFLLIMGSPLDPAGPFYDIETKLGKHYSHHHISQLDCSTAKGYWVDQAGIERKIAKYGAEHPLVLSNVYGEFAKAVEGALLSLRDYEKCINNPPPKQDGDMHGFIDVAGGGAKNVFAFRRGNVVWIVRAWREVSEMAAIGEIIGIYNTLKREHGITCEHISIDASGAGKPMADRLDELGYRFNRFNGQSPPRFDTEYYNGRAEVYGRGCAQIKNCGYILPDNEDFRMQILQATMKRHSSGKFLMTSKEDLAKLGLASPDEADAVLGACMPAPRSKSFSMIQKEQTRWQQSITDQQPESGERRYFQ